MRENKCMKKRIGFVILVWNSEAVIESCLDSIFSLQEIGPYVVVIDNGSTDATETKLAKHMQEHPQNIDLVRYEKNMGTTISRNAGLRKLFLLDLDYYCILDSDTVINDEAMLKLIAELDSHVSYGMIGPQMITSTGIVQMSARAFPTVLEKICKAIPIKRIQQIGEKMEVQQPDGKQSDSYPVDYLMSACWLMKPHAVKQVGLLDEKIFYAPEDAEYCIRMWKKGYQVAHCPSALIIHEWQRLSKKKLVSKINLEHVKGLLYMFYKHKYCLTTKRLTHSFPNVR